MVEMRLAAVRVELPTNTPVVLLQEAHGAQRTLPIFIGTNEATAIAFALQGVPTPRPMTHDLLRNVLVSLGAALDRVLVTELREGTFYAELHLTLGDHTYIVSSRPSDAIALAARLATPIFAEDALLDAEGVMLAADSEDPVETDEVVKQFRQFIDGVSPEDFASGTNPPE